MRGHVQDHTLATGTRLPLAALRHAPHQSMQLEGPLGVRVAVRVGRNGVGVVRSTPHRATGRGGRRLKGGEIGRGERGPVQTSGGIGVRGDRACIQLTRLQRSRRGRSGLHPQGGRSGALPLTIGDVERIGGRGASELDVQIRAAEWRPCRIGRRCGWLSGRKSEEVMVLVDRKGPRGGDMGPDSLPPHSEVGLLGSGRLPRVRVRAES